MCTIDRFTKTACGDDGERASDVLFTGPLRAAVTSDTAKNLTVLALLTEEKDAITVLLAHHGTPSLRPLDNITVDVTLSGLTLGEHMARTAIVGRINATSGNPKATWSALGAPDSPSPAELQKLMAASQPMEESVAVSVEAESDVAEGGLLVVKGVAVEAYSLVYVRISGVVRHAQSK